MTDLHVEDRLAVQEAIARYAHAFDTGDVAGFVDVFTEDGIFEAVLVDQPDQRAVFQGHAELRRFAEATMREDVHVLHHLAGVMFDSTAVEAPTSRATVLVTKQLPDGPAISTHGTYLDRWRRTSGGWRLAHRRYVALGYGAAHRSRRAPRH
ncbi:nuclear transport factor 2 family protein [Promicromonospora sp. NPDC057138]|uniref:nuclear transport factor 2 family protein n=1 Tax=Promicromonospora sp. NPDC057138 TaxID=3346031 RepID=UPI0036340E26